MVVKDLNRWFKEKWVDVSRKDKDGKHPPCGRSKANTSSKGYPKCRPSVKVSSKTPKTSGSMSEGQKRAATKRKRAKKQGVGGKPTIVKADRKLMYDVRELPTGPSRTPAWHGRTAPDDQGNTKQMVAVTPYGLKLHGGSAMFRTDDQGLLAPADQDFGEETVSRFTNRLAPVMAHEVGHALDAQQDAGSKFQTEMPAHVLEQATREAMHGRQGYAPQPILPKAHQLARDRFYDQGTNDFILPEDDPDYQYDITDDRIITGEPMDLSWRLLKRPVSPEAKRHKLEYDTKYESTPERLKYREELKRERRHRGIDGKGGPDMSHTKDHTLVAEDPHTNRARHFKERGTLKGDPMGIAWSFLKSDNADYNLSFFPQDDFAAGRYNPWTDTVDINLASILPFGRLMGFDDEDADKYTANVLGRLNAHEWGHAITDGQEGVGDLKDMHRFGPYSKDLNATARIEHPSVMMEYPESALVAHQRLLMDLNAHQRRNAGREALVERMFGQRRGKEHPMRGITQIMRQFDSTDMTPKQKEQRFREILGMRARNQYLRQDNATRTSEQWDKMIADERRKDRQRRGR